MDKQKQAGERSKLTEYLATCQLIGEKPDLDKAEQLAGLDYWAGVDEFATEQ